MSDQSTDQGGKVTVTFKPHGKITRVPRGMSIFNAASWIGLAIDSTCGARGTCGKCRVRLTSGDAAITDADRKVFTDSELADGWRLSCRAQVPSDIVCVVPRLMGNPKAALMGIDRHVVLDANVHKITLTLDPPSLTDQRSDWTRLQAALQAEGIEADASLPTLRQLPRLLRDSKWRVTAVVVGQSLVAVEPGDTTQRSYGLAIDIGTTTVVVSLFDLNSGAPAAVRSALNQQAAYGADVISRISHAMINADGLDQLSAKIVNTLNALIDEVLAEAQVKSHEVYEAVVVGNATMLHLLLRADPTAIGITPFIPIVDNPFTVTAEELKLRLHPAARIHGLPLLGAYVGADVVAGVLASGLAQREDGVRLLIDVGTNGEIVLGSAARTIATAAPAGPAFEGAEIKHGMRAAEGAIEAVAITRDGVHVEVIGSVPPVGLCGSGMLDAVAQLRLVGLVDATGKLMEHDVASRDYPEHLVRRIISDERGERAFVLVWHEASGSDQPITLTQRDIRQLQFAKGAIASGVAVLMDELGVAVNDLVEVFLAGSFGTYINPMSARITGLVPPVPVERIKAIGNAAGEGAKMALLSFRERQVAHALPHIVEYHELSGRAGFNDAFIDVLQFPELADLDED